MKKILTLCLSSLLLAGCASSEGQSPFKSYFSCDIPAASHYPTIESTSDLLVNMRKLGVDAERKNVVAAQWAQQATDANEKTKIESCSSEIRQASIEIIQPQVSRVQSVTTGPNQLNALNDVNAKWLAYMNSITLKGTDASLAKAFNNAADNLDKM
ncbi:hypothetical protein [Hafnia alvei]|uniref:Lipoprotein n=1 Tax=Hafnia alvei TaxID=569 RepID=A0A1C6Z3M1_HAFAL|nr:hypothetical protein [Hafnia alvei]NLS55690.1 hypothetical protein [Hafnia alvei]SCM53707.1 hypothetical protein BN1044_03202 [Hafnia alvei]